VLLKELTLCQSGLIVVKAFQLPFRMQHQRFSS
jgi:hypothetical protein